MSRHGSSGRFPCGCSGRAGRSEPRTLAIRSRSEPPRVLYVLQRVAGDRDDVEARAFEARLADREIHQRDARDLAPLLPVHGLERTAELRAAPAAHLDEHEHVAVARDDVELAELAAIVALDDLHALAH